MSTSLSVCIFCALLAKTKSIGLAVPPLLERKKRTAPGFFWSTRGITASEHKKAQSEEKGSRTIYLSSHTEHISVGTRTCFLRTESFIYSTVCRKKNNQKQPQQSMDFFFVHSCQKTPNKSTVIFSLLPTLELSLELHIRRTLLEAQNKMDTFQS